LIILADQALKIWIKTSYPCGPVMNKAGASWAQLYFIENKGMAWGMELFGGKAGKIMLTLFRLIAVIFGSWYLAKITRQRYTRGFIVCACLIYAGALGNLLDSMFYGLIFSASDYNTVAQAFPKGGGYEGFLQGHVVDMLYFPIVRNATWPSWMPIVGGKGFEFFSPIFNIADAAISIGVITLLLFQKRFLHRHHDTETVVTEETIPASDRATGPEADPHTI
ncbi:MAG: lipoprotein signal peptidase, partial [Flaviaesturariibacter sp.]|nr:lipoprotein signal peptidase [Flaviaesturariibacter sp.]